MKPITQSILLVLLTSSMLQAQIYGVGNGGGFAFAIKGGSGSEVSLPIELLFFDGQCKESEVKLEWQTASEQNNEYFTIERSLDTKQWELIGTKPGAGNSNEIVPYDFIDPKPLEKAYYRLKQTDMNGDFEYSSMIFVKCDQEKGPQPIIFPNPSSGLLSIQNAVEGQKLVLFNQLGQILYQDVLTSTQKDLFLDYLPKGVYFIQLSDEYQMVTEKVVLE